MHSRARVSIFIGMGLVILFYAAEILYQTRPWEEPNKFDRTRNDLTRLNMALQDYRVEYGHFPELPRAGMVETEDENAALMRILTGRDERANPTRRDFIELSSLIRQRRGAINRRTGAFIDRWGHPYRLRFATDETGTVKSPYGKQPDFVGKEIIAWSLGEDGRQETNDDIISWGMGLLKTQRRAEHGRRYSGPIHQR